MSRGNAIAVTPAGFSLVELAIVLLILGLLTGGGLTVWQVQAERAQRQQQAEQLEAIREALYGYAVSARHLPCPDTDYPPDGRENRDPDGACRAAEGALPGAELGIGRADAWGRPLRYRVTPDFARQTDTGVVAFGLDDDGDVRVVDAAGDALATAAPAAVISFGVQGGAVWRADGPDCPGLAEGFSTRASRNCDASSATFVDAGYREDGGDGAFKHQLTWLSGPVLKARMIAAGWLP